MRTQTSNTVARSLRSMHIYISPKSSTERLCYLFKIEYFPHLSLMMSKNCAFFFFISILLRYRSVVVVVHNLLRHHISRARTKDMSNRFSLARREKKRTHFNFNMGFVCVCVCALELERCCHGNVWVAVGSSEFSEYFFSFVSAMVINQISEED